MKFFLLLPLLSVSVSFVGSQAMTPEVYWKSILPNTSMPKSIKDLLYTELNDEKSTAVGVGKGVVKVHTGLKVKPDYVILSAAYFITYLSSGKVKKDDPNVSLFFLRNDLHQGTEFNLHFTKTDQNLTFLPRKIADLIPFSSNNLSQIYNEFSVKPDSLEAEIIKHTLKQCEDKTLKGEEKYCATSLESMVDFCTTKLGKNVKAISTEANNKESIPFQKYKIQVAKKLATNKVVVCHKRKYVYAVFYCHKSSTEAYVVSMIGTDGTKVNAAAICHMDTSKWNPKHFTFQLLKVKPGTIPICHFLPEDQVVWVPY
ncbi:BURP domain protein RD22-like [Bidens hawaiensis]|uniref:BURP domain protein RD22-like n=1 Tax=Bidens hawaiensis TaxID=980011 RepID=UPI0040499874